MCHLNLNKKCYWIIAKIFGIRERSLKLRHTCDVLTVVIISFFVAVYDLLAHVKLFADQALSLFMWNIHFMYLFKWRSHNSSAYTQRLFGLYNKSGIDSIIARIRKNLYGFVLCVLLISPLLTLNFDFGGGILSFQDIKCSILIRKFPIFLLPGPKTVFFWAPAFKWVS